MKLIQININHYEAVEDLPTLTVGVGRGGCSNHGTIQNSRPCNWEIPYYIAQYIFCL